MAVLTQDIINRALALQAADPAQPTDGGSYLAQQQAQYEATRGNTLGETVGNVGPQLLSGAVSLGQQAYGLANMASLGFLDRAAGLSSNFQDTQNILSQAQSAPTQRAAQQVNDAFENQGVLAGLKQAATSPAFIQQAALQSLPSLLPAAGAARWASGTAGAYALARGAAEKEARDLVEHSAEKAVLAASGAQSAGGTNIDAINAIQQAGGDQNQQQAGGLGAGLIAGIATPIVGKLTGAAALEGRAANLFGGTMTPGAAATAAGIAKGVVGGAAREGAEETLQSSSEQMAQNIVTPGKSLMDGVGQQAAVGGLLGGLLGGAMGGLSVNTPRIETPLKQELNAATAEANAAAGNPIQPTALGDKAETSDIADTLQAAEPVPEPPVTDIPLPNGTTVPGQEFDLGATPLPQVQPDPNEVVLQDVQPESIDLGAAAPLPDATPAPSPLEPVDMAAAPVPGQDVPLYDQDYRVPAPLPQVDGEFGDTTWKQRMAKELGLKGGSFNSDTWKQFTTDAEASGYHPEDPNSAQFLGEWAAGQMANASNKTPAFVEKLAQAYPVAQPTAPVTPELAPAPAAVASDPAPAPVETTPDIPALQAAVTEAENRTAYLRTKEGGRDVVGARYSRVDELNARAALAAAQGDDRGARSAQKMATKALREATEMDLAGEAKKEANIQAGASALAPVVEGQPASPGSPSTGALPLTIDQMIRQTMSNDPDHTVSSATAEAYVDAMMDAHNPSDLDGLFASIKNHTGWNKLTAADKTEVADNFERLYARMDGDAGRFDRATEAVGPKESISIEDLRTLVAAANRNKPANSGEVFAVPTVADFQAMASQAAPQDARGVFTKDNLNRIYLIAENLRDPKDVAMTLAHERGHNGLAALLGDRLPAVVNRLWTNPATRRRIQDKIKQLKMAENGAPVTGSIRRVAAEEVLADMFAAGEPVANDVITKARSAIEQGMANLLGMGKLTMKNSEVDALLRDVGAVLNDAPGSMTRGNAHVGLEDLMADPAQWLSTSARFSRADGDIDEIINKASVEEGGTRRSLYGAVMDATAAGGALAKAAVTNSPLNTASKVFDATATLRDKTRGLLLDATPLNQVANLYGKMFDGGIATLARIKRAKESLHNKILTEEKEVSYHGQRMTTSPVALSGEWQKFRQTNKAKGEALDALQQTATLYRLFPDRDLASQSKLDHGTVGFTAEEREAQHSNVQKLWKAIGPEGQTLYKKSQAVYSNLWNQRFEALTKAIDEAGTGQYVLNPDGTPQLNEQGKQITTDAFKKQMKTRVDAALTKMAQGPYSPLQRYGDYLVTARTADGKVAWFSGHDTLEQAKKMQVQLRTGEFAGPDYAVAATLRREHNFDLDGMSQSTIQRIESAVDGMPALKENPALAKQIHQGLVEAYLQSLPQSSFLQHANARKNIRGATSDAFRAFNDYSVKASRSISSLTHDGNIDRQLTALQKYVTDKTSTGTVSADEAVKMQRVLEAVRRQHAASQKFERSPVADALSAAGFVQFLSSPSQLLINALQTPMITLPRLAAAYGNGQGLKSFKEAMVHFAKSRGDLLGEKSVLAKDSPEHQVLTELYNRGTLDFTLSHDMTGLANGEGAAMSGHWRKIMEVAGWSMQKSEVFNRQVTALSVVRAEMAKAGPTAQHDIKMLADRAEDVVYDTQGDYSQTNKPPLMQGPWRKVIFQFQHYRLNMLAMMARDIRDSFAGTKEEKQSARRALAWTVGMQAALTGAAGTVLAPIAFALMDMFRDDDDLLDSRTEFARFAPQWLVHGALAGVVDLSRVSGAGLLSFGQEYAPQGASAKDTFNYYVLANIGPWAGLGANIAAGGEAMVNGDHLKAAKNLMPALFRDPYKAYFESQQGAKDSRGVEYYEPNLWDGVLGAAGLRSGSRVGAEELRGAAYEADKNAQVLRSRVSTMYATAHATSDFDLLAEAQQRNAALGAKYPGMQVNPKSAIVNMARSQQNANLYGIPDSRAPTPAMKEVLGL